MNKNLSPKNSNDKRIVNRQKVVPATKPSKRENTFSQSRDIREDRSLRQMKNSPNTKAAPPVRDRKFMKTKITLLAIGTSLLLAAPALLAQNTNTNSIPLNHTLKYQVALEHDRSLGEQSLLPPGLKEKLQLTEAQRTELKPFEDDFAKTSLEYQTANQPRIDAAIEANRQARATKDATQIQTARAQLQQIWAGLQPDRVATVTKIKPLLTPQQVKILEDPRNQWRENHAEQANDPSAN